MLSIPSPIRGAITNHVFTLVRRPTLSGIDPVIFWNDRFLLDVSGQTTRTGFNGHVQDARSWSFLLFESLLDGGHWLGRVRL